VHVHVGRVLELLRHPGARRRGNDLLRLGDRALHALLARCQLEPGAIGQHQAPALDAHAVGHDQDQRVALDRRHHRQADAGVARGRLDDGATGFQQAARLGVLDHGQRDAVLDRTARVGALGLDPDFGRAEQALHADVRRAADGGEDVFHFHASTPGIMGW
jgi:hypothetical protein